MTISTLISRRLSGWATTSVALASALLAACAQMPAPNAAATPPASSAALPPAVAAATPPAQTAATIADNPGSVVVTPAGPAAAAAAAATAAASAAIAAARDAATPPEDEASAADAAGKPSDPLEPEKAVQLDDAAANADLWSRIRSGFGMPALDSQLVRDHEQWYSRRPDYVQRMTERGGRYLYHIIEEVQKRGMPSELALLPFIESAFNPQAMSTAKASGMWQFIPSTGRDYSLKQNVFRDDRRDVLASTRAALDYLGRLHDMFGDWQLALAAYNWGEGNVAKAVARNQRAGLPADYANLNMPVETRNYVPKLEAVKNIVAEPERFGLALPELRNHPYFLSVPIQRDIDVDLAARLAGLPTDEFKTLNPQMNKPVILAAGTPQVLLPYDNADRFVRNLGAHRGPLASWTAWVVPRTMRPGDAAKQHDMSESVLRDINRIPPRMLVKAGSTLLVPRSAHRNEDVSERLAETAALALAPDVPPGRRITIKARKGDTLASIAQRYRVTPAQVAQWNRIGEHGKLAVGSGVVVYTTASIHTAAAAPARKPTKQLATTRVVRETSRRVVTAQKAAGKGVRVARASGAREH